MVKAVLRGKSLALITQHTKPKTMKKKKKAKKPSVSNPRKPFLKESNENN